MYVAVQKEWPWMKDQPDLWYLKNIISLDSTFLASIMISVLTFGQV